MKKIKIILDIIMTILFTLLMGYQFISGSNHEILGTITFILFLTHNIINIKWYKTILKGKYNFLRVFTITINILLLIAIILMMISGIMISSEVFAFLNIKTTMLGRSLHMISTSWGYILMAIHVGLHLSLLITKLNRKLKETMFEYINYLIQGLIVIFGIYSFYSNKLISDMFLLSHFKLYDYNQSSIVFYLEFISILIAISIIVHYLLLIIKKSKRKK